MTFSPDGMRSLNSSSHTISFPTELLEWFYRELQAGREPASLTAELLDYGSPREMEQSLSQKERVLIYYALSLTAPVGLRSILEPYMKGKLTTR